MTRRRLELPLVLAALLLVVEELRFAEDGIWGPTGMVLALLAGLAAVALQVFCWAIGWVCAPRNTLQRSRVARVSAQTIAVLLVLFSIVTALGQAPGILTDRLGSAYAAWAAALCGVVLLGWLLFRLPEPLTRGVLAWAIAAVLVVAIVEGIAASLARTHSAPDEPASGPANFYYIVLDGLAGPPALPRSIEGAHGLANRMMGDYRRSGFEVFERVHSNFYWTHLSLLSIFGNRLQFQYFPKADPHHNKLRPNRLFDEIAESGLHPVVYYSDYLDACTAALAHDPTCISYSAVSPRRGTPMNARLPLHLMGIAYRFRQLPVLKQKRTLFGNLNSLAVLDQLIEDAVEHPRGRFVFAHILLPHYPYLLDAQCRVRNDELWRRDVVNYHGTNGPGQAIHRWKQYLGQMECVHGRIMQLVDRLSEAGVLEESTLIIHGDHGSRISLEGPYGPDREAKSISMRRFLDFYSTLLVVKRGEYPLTPSMPGSRVGWRSISSVIAELLGWPEAKGLEYVYLQANKPRYLRPVRSGDSPRPVRGTPRINEAGGRPSGGP